MYVCLCHGINDRQVRAAIDEGNAGSAAHVFRHLECKPRCGKCVPFMTDMVTEAKGSRPGCDGKGGCRS